MFLKMNGFMTKEPVVINPRMIIRMYRMKEEKGTVIVLSDGSKALVMHSMDNICNEIGIIIDMTKETEEMEETEDGFVDS